MNEQDLRKKIAVLESVNDQLSSELACVDDLMRMIGFTDGLETVKATAQDLFEQGGFDLSEEEEE